MHVLYFLFNACLLLLLHPHGRPWPREWHEHAETVIVLWSLKGSQCQLINPKSDADDRISLDF